MARKELPAQATTTLGFEVDMNNIKKIIEIIIIALGAVFIMLSMSFLALIVILETMSWL